MKARVKRLFKSTRGVTLMELLVSILITGVIMAAVSVTYVDSTRHYTRNRETSQAQMRSRLSIDFMMKEVRNAGYLINWDAGAVSPALDTAVPVGATPDPGTDTLTVRYAIGPFTGAGAQVAVLNGPHNFGIGTDTLTVNPLTFPLPTNTLVAIYAPPVPVNVRRVEVAAGVNATAIDLATDYTSNFSGIGTDVVVPVQESSFWIENRNLWMRTGIPPANSQLATNVEDLQVVFLDCAGTVAPPGTTIRAVRLSLTVRSANPVQNRAPSPPPSLEDHIRAAEPADQILRQTEQTTIYLRNFGTLTTCS